MYKKTNKVSTLFKYSCIMDSYLISNLWLVYC